MPGWVPGTEWKRTVEVARKSMEFSRDVQFREVKEKLVRTQFYPLLELHDDI